jgi:DNA-binding response OmpR family regulator
MTLTKRHILCVDFDHETCPVITQQLGPLGFEVKGASTMGEALELIEGERFDLYLLERRLSDGSGVELSRKIRAVDPRAPILFFAREVRKSDRHHAVNAGAQGYLGKPKGIYELAEIITRLRQEARIEL